MPPTPPDRLTVLRTLSVIPATGALSVLGMTALTRGVGRLRTFTADEVPVTDVAIVLGAQVHPGGVPSGFLEARLQLAAKLWRTGKVRAILVSGADGAEHHHEARAMKTWLTDHGVPENRIACDPGGHDTFATMARAVGVYGLNEVTVVTQSYHLPRALSTARGLGLKAYGVGDTSARRWLRCWRRGQAREVFANIKLFTELVTRERPSNPDNRVLAILQDAAR